MSRLQVGDTVKPSPEALGLNIWSVRVKGIEPEDRRGTVISEHPCPGLVYVKWSSPNVGAAKGDPVYRGYLELVRETPR